MSMSWRLSWCPISDVQMPMAEWANRAARVGDAREKDGTEREWLNQPLSARRSSVQLLVVAGSAEIPNRARISALC